MKLQMRRMDQFNLTHSQSWFRRCYIRGPLHELVSRNSSTFAIFPTSHISAESGSFICFFRIIQQLVYISMYLPPSALGKVGSPHFSMVPSKRSSSAVAYRFQWPKICVFGA